MNARKLVPYALNGIVASVMLMAAVAGEQSYEITRSTISGGGTTSSTGGDYVISSTIGQPLNSVLAGGGYSIDGGFRYAIASGDCEADGYVDLIDHQQFLECVTGPAAPNGTDACQCYDVNLSGTIDLLDFADVQTAFTGS